MKRSVIRIAILASALSVFAILSGPGLVAGQATEPATAKAPDYTVTVGGSTLSNVQSGTVISRATRLANGRCNNGEMVIDVQGRKGYEGVVSVSIDSHCVIRLEGVSSQRIQTSTTPGVAFSSEERSAYTKSELNDEIGLDLLLARVDIEYTDDGSSLSDGDASHRCDKIFYWELHSCTSAHNDTSATKMWGWTRAEADGLAFQPTHAKANVWVWPDERTKHRCYNGQTYQGTHWRCRYGSS